MFRKLFLGAAGALALATSPASAAQYQFNIFLPPTNFIWPVLKTWASEINTKTDGRVDIVFPAQSVVPPSRVMDAVRSQVVDGGIMANIFLPPSLPGARAGMLPWVNTGDAEAASVALWDTYEKFFKGKENWSGLKLVGLFQYGKAKFCSTINRPLTTVSDLRQRKVWALPGVNAQVLQRMGVPVSASPAVHIFELVSRNVVQAFVGIPAEGIVSFKAGPYTKSCLDMKTSLSSVGFSMFFSQAAWNRLSPNDQKTVMKLSGDHFARMFGKAFDAADKKATHELKAQGVKFVPIDPALAKALKAAAQPTIDDWIATVTKHGIDGRAAYDFMAAQTAKLTKADAAK